MVSVQNLPRTGRVTRSPRHNFQIRAKPFVIQPFLLAPVLPGETLKSAVMQARAVTDPIKNGLVGWWLEYYFFYVKHRDLDGRDDFSEMMLDLDKDMSAYRQAAAAATYNPTNGFDWAELCLKRVVEEYFRDEDEAWNIATIDSMPVAKINMDGVFQSAVLDDNFVGTQDVSLTVGVDDAITASELDATMRTWQFQREHGLTPMDYEDWLATYGIKPKAQEHHRPELLRYVREWQYPSNTVNPTDGTAAAAVSWAVAETVNKDRFFREPGFIFGVTIARPKIYLKNQDGAVANVLQSALDWLPAVMRDDPYTSLRKYAETAAPYSIVTDANGYWLDIKDLFIYGDQFINFANTETNANLVALPTATLNTNYVASTDVEALFSGANYFVRQDGVVQFNILGALTDTTPSVRAG